MVYFHFIIDLKREIESIDLTSQENVRPIEVKSKKKHQNAFDTVMNSDDGELFSSSLSIGMRHVKLLLHHIVYIAFAN